MGKLYLILVAIMIFIAVSLSGIFAPPFPEGKDVTIAAENYFCCETGDGANCHPVTNSQYPPITFKNNEYRLLKSNMYIITLDSFHLRPAEPGNVRKGPRNERVFINPTQDAQHDRVPDCRAGSGKDRLYGPLPPGVDPQGQTYGCYEIPDDLLIYLCRSDSQPGECGKSNFDNGQIPNAGFDVYIRTSKGEAIPSIVSNCTKPPLPTGGDKSIVFRVSPGGQPNLQLRTFKFIVSPPPGDWLSPYCKPAIYLYPERKTEVNVSVFPQGKMLTTIPPYPKSGWDVVADPDGTIHVGQQTFDYLYYEASLPDSLITPPKEGFVMDYNERSLFLTDLVTKLGLNDKETKQFVDYWVPILPKSPYYFVGVVPQTTLHELSPLFITPQPKHLIRVTLYFKPLDEKTSVTQPLIFPVTRDGFTAVEWGGIFKQDKNHPFSCFM